MNPTEGCKAWLDRKDIAAKFRETLEISECIGVIPNKIYCGNKVEKTCYKYTPVEVDSQIYFIKSGTRDLIEISPEIPCGETIKPIFKENDSWQSWDNILGKQVEIFPNLMPFQYISTNTIFNSQTPFQQQEHNLYDLLTVLSRYSNRINVLNDVFNENNIIMNDTNILAEIGEIMGNFSLANSTIIPEWLTDPVGKFKLIFKELVSIFIMIGITIVGFCALGLLIYTYRWWIFLFKIFKGFKCCRRRKKYKVNNVNTQNEPSAPTEPESFILDYVLLFVKKWKYQFTYYFYWY